uniref:Uncharacterized protein n=1 Tax=Elaeophora elaphi TaxID=1147741 RepID=A0A0R3RNE5_9BILA
MNTPTEEYDPPFFVEIRCKSITDYEQQQGRVPIKRQLIPYELTVENVFVMKHFKLLHTLRETKYLNCKIENCESNLIIFYHLTKFIRLLTWIPIPPVKLAGTNIMYVKHAFTATTGCQKLKAASFFN